MEKIEQPSLATEHPAKQVGGVNRRSGKIYHRDLDFQKAAASAGRQRRQSITWCTIATIVLCLLEGWHLILALSWWSALGVFLLAEGMILSWYLRHECGHFLAFKSKKRNILLGEMLSWITGELQSPFTEYRRAHLRHHAEQIDLVGVDLQRMLERYPHWARSAILRLEAIYVPVIYLIVKVDGICADLFAPAGRRGRVVCAITGYIIFFGALARVSFISFMLYLFAVIIRIHCIRFVDAFQHTYDRVEGEGRVKPRGWVYEQRNTYSTPIAKKHGFLNLLILNFGFHNAHHAVPNCPWYRLPRIDQALSRCRPVGGQANETTFSQEDDSIELLLRSYHQHRVNRIINPDSGTAYGLNNHFSMAAFRGAFTDNLLG